MFHVIYSNLPSLCLVMIVWYIVFCFHFVWLTFKGDLQFFYRSISVKIRITQSVTTSEVIDLRPIEA